MLRLENRVTGKDRKALVSRTVTSGRYDSHACAALAVQPTRGKPRTIYRQRACLLLNTCSALERVTHAIIIRSNGR